jgi:hypothetical protein
MVFNATFCIKSRGVKWMLWWWSLLSYTNTNINYREVRENIYNT